MWNLLRNFDTSHVDAIDLLKFLLKENGMTGADLGRLLGKDPGLGSKILRRDRPLNNTHIRILSERFKISPAAFFRVLETA